MRDFSWNIFTKTGEINAYLLYKDLEVVGVSQENQEAELEEQESTPSN